MDPLIIVRLIALLLRRGLLGRMLVFVIGPVVRKVAGPSGTCPHCGFLVGSMASSCAQCGYNPGLARMAMAMPVASVSLPQPPQPAIRGPILPMGQCPNCEEIIPMSSRSCPICRYKPDPQGSTPA